MQFFLFRYHEIVRLFPVEYRLFAPVYFFLSLINLRVKILLTPDWMNGILLQNHFDLLAFRHTNNEQSRLLQFYVPEFFHKLLLLDIPDSYLLQRWLFIFLALLCFHLYLRRWFSSAESFAGVTFLAAIMPLTYFNDLQESAPLLLLLFLLGLWALRDGRDLLFGIILFIGALTNETMLILTAAYVFVHYKGRTPRSLMKLAIQTVKVGLPAWAALGIIRWMTRESPHLGDPFALPANLAGIGQHMLDFLQYSLHAYQFTYLYPFFLFGAFWIYAAWQWKHEEPYLKRVSLIIPLFLAAHLFTGVIFEVRQLLPLSFILIPMAMHFIRRRLAVEAV